jgi:hypothetical protein
MCTHTLLASCIHGPHWAPREKWDDERQTREDYKRLCTRIPSFTWCWKAFTLEDPRHSAWGGKDDERRIGGELIVSLRRRQPVVMRVDSREVIRRQPRRGGRSVDIDASWIHHVLWLGSAWYETSILIQGGMRGDWRHLLDVGRRRRRSYI